MHSEKKSKKEKREPEAEQDQPESTQPETEQAEDMQSESIQPEEAAEPDQAESTQSEPDPLSKKEKSKGLRFMLHSLTGYLYCVRGVCVCRESCEDATDRVAEAV